MVSEIVYYDSNYNYINPVRHFKANDPYYYEVDNIPIKQLEESKNFLKDQVDGILKDRANFKIEVDRSHFTELQPFVTGVDRKVRVKPGRYTARVNDAYSVTPIQFIAQVAGFSNTTEGNAVAPVNTYQVEKMRGAGVSAALETFQAGLTGAALNMNGLAERTFTYPIPDEDGIDPAGGEQFLNATSIGDYINLRSVQPAVGYGGSRGNPTLPNIIGDLYSGGNLSSERMQNIRNVYTPGATIDATQSGRLESSFIKRWRGAIRTSIVDVSGELSVTVPDFNEGDFYYDDENGNRQQLAANQRIDLVFIYSKAIDQSETTLPERGTGNVNRVIRKPVLGILKGAGIGVNKNPVVGEDSVTDLNSLNGTPIMLAHPGDENSPNTGFETSTAGIIRGSFPSPDDLLNLAPVLSENLESDSIALIGQSILPVAYIRVTNAGGTVDIIEENDVIDIRPFFRTTELAYNERAGIAAATPQVSISNPVVTESALDKVRREVYADLKSRIDNLDIPEESPSRVVGAGTICGGMRYGPEGALFRQAAPNILGGQLQTTNWNDLADAAETFFNYLPGSITFNPAWDIAPWALTKTPNPGQRPADHIHVCWPMIAESTNPSKYYLPPWNRSVGMGTYTNVNLLQGEVAAELFPALHTFGVKRTWYDATDGLTGDYKSLRQNVFISYVRKVIRINRNNVPWMTDYSVNASLLNCIPLSSANDTGNKRSGRSANASHVWVNKARDYFVINVAWVSDDYNRRTHDMDFGDPEGIPWANRNSVEELAGFALPEIPIPNPGDFQQYTVQARSMPGQQSGQGNTVLSLVNRNANGGTGLNNELTNINYFTDVTPILYPSVQYEIIGHSDRITSRSPRGNSLINGRTPEIELV